MSKTKFAMPPKRSSNTVHSAPVTGKGDKAMLDIINKGGSPAKNELTSEQVEVVLKNINLKVPGTDLQDFKDIIDKLPKEPGKKKAISIDRWILQAACEKRDLLLGKK